MKAMLITCVMLTSVCFANGGHWELDGMESTSGGKDKTKVVIDIADGRFNFRFDTKDPTPSRTKDRNREMGCEFTDRVELYFSPTADLSKRYYCIEMDPDGHVLDYSCDYYRKFDDTWNFRTKEICPSRTADGYVVKGSVDMAELAELGITPENLHMCISRADFAEGGVWKSWNTALPMGPEPDFHLAKMFQRLWPDERSNLLAKVDFSDGKWDPSKWIVVKNRRWDYTGRFDQCSDHIVNHTPDVSDEELKSKYFKDVAANMVYDRWLDDGVEISSTMSFDDEMAPMIVLARGLGKDSENRVVFDKFYQVVLFDKGVNVWAYEFSNGKVSWRLAAFSEFPLERKRKYMLNVLVREVKGIRQVDIAVDGHVFGFQDPTFKGLFYAGISGCEGRTRFYDFRVEQTKGAGMSFRHR